MTVLIIDENAVASMTEANHASREGFHVVRKKNCQEAMHAIVAGLSVDLVISQMLGMGMTGIDLHKRLALDPLYRNIPVVLLSDRLQKDKIPDAEAAGCKRIYMKPVTAEKFSEIRNEIFPGMKLFIKGCDAVCQELEIGEEDYMNMLWDYVAQTEAALESVKKANDTGRINMEIGGLQDGASLLGTDKLGPYLEYIRGMEIDQKSEVLLAVEEIREQVQDRIHYQEKGSRRRPPSAYGVENSLAPREEPEDNNEPDVDFPEDSDDTRESLLASAEAGYPEKQFLLGMAYLRGGLGFSEDLASALQWLQAAADQSYPRALCHLGVLKLLECTEEGSDQVEWKDAQQLFMEAAKSGNQEARFFYKASKEPYTPGSNDGLSFLVGAADGNAESQYQTGLLFDLGIDIPQNTIEAFYWFDKSAEQNHPKALLKLGIMFEAGRCGKESKRHCIDYFIRSAELDQMEAQVALGRAYSLGSFVKQDNAEARKWYELAAAKGNISSQYALAQLLEFQEGTVENPVSEAYKWYLVGALNGSKKSGKRAEELKPQLTEDEIKRASIHARAIKEKNDKLASESAT